MFSKWKKNAIRFIHLPSMTVFNNWPNLRTKLNFISTTKFSKDGRYILIGNDEG
jgi:U3 small nucleolar RNA-associated protein 18